MIELTPICKIHKIKMKNVGFHKEVPDYRKWECELCEKNKTATVIDYFF
jgi:hypothetical protein